jgi:hypothetical protein
MGHFGITAGQLLWLIDTATLNSCKAWVAGVVWFLLFIFMWPIYALVNLSAAVPADFFFTIR